MKSIMAKVSVVWLALLVISLLLLQHSHNLSQTRIENQKNAWIERQFLLVEQKVRAHQNGGSLIESSSIDSPSTESSSVDNSLTDDILVNKDLMQEVLSLPSVAAARTISAGDVVEQVIRITEPVSTITYRLPLQLSQDSYAVLEVDIDMSQFAPVNIDSFSLHGFAILVLMALGVFMTLWLLSPFLMLEKKAESILTGDFNPQHFASSDDHPLTSELAINLLLDEHQKSKQQHQDLSNRLRQHSFVDNLTGLGNRDYFDAELEIHLKNEKESIHGAVVLFSFEPLLDLHYENPTSFNELIKQVGDFFQNISDEENLCWVARRDTVDFALLTLESAPDKIRRQCHKVIKDLQRSIFDITEFSHHFINIGVTFFTSGDDAYEILASADMSLRNAQLQGDNCVHMYQPNKLAKSMIKGGVRWRTILQSILDSRRITLFFQPQVAAVAMDVQRYEVLSRIEDRGKMINASIFLPMANRCGLAADFDRLIVDKALKQLTSQADSIELSINLFPDSLLHPSFMKWLMQRLSINRFANHRIIFEISELAVSRSLVQVKAPMEKVAAMGCRWCVEHVGSPNASLSYLAELPLDFLKISQATVRRINTQQERQLFVETLVTSAAQAGINVWAEGVESEQEWLKLQSLGIQGGQGYWFGHPQELIPSIEDEILSVSIKKA